MKKPRLLCLYSSALFFVLIFSLWYFDSISRIPSDSSNSTSSPHSEWIFEYTSPPATYYSTHQPITFSLRLLSPSHLATSNQLHFYPRLIGPAVVVGTFAAHRVNNTYMFHFIANEPGNYTISLTLSYFTYQYAYALTHFQPKCICSTLHLSPSSLIVDELSPFKKVMPTPSNLCTGQDSWQKGVWKRSENGWTWTTPDCKLLDYVSPGGHDRLYQCFSSLQLILVGDSHTTQWYEWFQQKEIKNVEMKKIRGITPHGIDKKVAEDVWLKNYSLDWKMFKAKYPSAIYGEGLLEFLSKLDLKAKGYDDNRDRVMVSNSGHWDLRDDSVENYNHETLLAFSHLHRIRKNNSMIPNLKFVWRTSQAYSYKRKQWAGREYRTNEKFQKATQHQLKTAPAVVDWIHNSFAISFPFFESSCDSHHYLCVDQSDEANWIGLADLNAFLNSLCNERQ